MHAKQQRDGKRYSVYQLSKEIDVNRSIIQRILNGEVVNPRLDTLIKIANFFTKDGLLLSLDELVNLDHISELNEHYLTKEIKMMLPLYDMANSNESMGNITASVPASSTNTVAFLSKNKVEPIFSAGSIFIVDLVKKPKHSNLIAIKSTYDDTVSIAKYKDGKNNTPFATTIDLQKTINLNNNNKLIGVVIKAHMNT